MTLFLLLQRMAHHTGWFHLSKLYRARDVMMNLHYKHLNTIDFSHHLSKGIFALGYKAVETPGQFNLDFSESLILERMQVFTVLINYQKIFRSYFISMIDQSLFMN